jgi:arylsulfatase
MLYAARDADAFNRRHTQYFEIFSNRAIYHDGWLARVVHRVPWQNLPIRTLQEDVWELYDAKEDFSLSTDLASKYPRRLAAMKDLFEREAIRNNVYPLDDRSYERFNAAIAGRPDLMGDRTSLTLAHGMTGILENTFINEKNTSKTITAKVQLKGNDRGVILCQGGKFGGWALYMDQGKPAYTYNWFGLHSYTVAATEAIRGDQAEIKLQFDYDEAGEGRGKGGKATLYVNGKQVAAGRIEKTQPALYSADETADVGIDEATPVANKVFKDAEDSKFTGFVDEVTISIPARK